MTILVLVAGCVRAPTYATSSAVGATSGNGVLNLAGVDPITLDPATVSELNSNLYVSQIFSGLLRLNDDMQPVPDMAESMPSVSSDGRTYTFKLMSDLKFQDGNPVSASDFKYSWERASTPSTRSLTASTYLSDIVGVNDMLSGSATSVSGVKVVDDLTMQITIDSPKSYFIRKFENTP
jgi:oligopeptide transport system substrate-binding protein